MAEKFLGAHNPGTDFKMFDAWLRENEIPPQVWPPNYKSFKPAQIDMLLQSTLQNLNNAVPEAQQVCILILSGLFTTPYYKKLLQFKAIPKLLAAFENQLNHNWKIPYECVPPALANLIVTLGENKTTEFVDLSQFYEGNAVKLLLRIMQKEQSDPKIMEETLSAFSKLVEWKERVPAPIQLSVIQKIDIVTEAIATVFSRTKEYSRNGTLPTAAMAFNFLEPYYANAYSQVPPPERKHLLRLLKANIIRGLTVIITKSIDDDEIAIALHDLAHFIRPSPRGVFDSKAHLTALKYAKTFNEYYPDARIQSVTLLSQLAQWGDEEMLNELVKIGLSDLFIDLLNETPPVAFPAKNEIYKYFTLVWPQKPEDAQRCLTTKNTFNVMFADLLMFLPSGDREYSHNALRTSLLRHTLGAFPSILTNNEAHLKKIFDSSAVQYMAQLIINRDTPDRLLPNLCSDLAKLLQVKPDRTLEKLQSMSGGVDAIMTKLKALTNRLEPTTDDKLIRQSAVTCLYHIRSAQNDPNQPYDPDFSRILLTNLAENFAETLLTPIPKRGPTPNDMIRKPPPMSACANCQNTAAKMKCGKCMAVVYCKRECQIQHWPIHKLECGKRIEVDRMTDFSYSQKEEERFNKDEA
eukprot:TRINITY_DN4300_c0_g1_i1.p1 TRINITY_DN4300_c0_g1~~TRINITY_DN4300_c0_g1_i1.p1  ORF type:complete len:635 (-),score=134.19 TRINITY_DN4300_c0_g1_i1:1217-3121(-)